MSSSYPSQVVTALINIETSATIQLAFSKLDHDFRLVVDIMPSGSSGALPPSSVSFSENTYTLGMIGPGDLQALSQIRFIRTDGTLGIGISMEQMLAHELSHALVATKDTLGSGSSIDYHGDAVRFVNQVLDNGRQANGSVDLPVVLPPYPGGKTRISAASALE